MTTTAFAMEPTNFPLTNDVEDLINEAISYEELYVIDEMVTYYYGNDYTVVKDRNGYSVINFMTDGNILVNGELIKTNTRVVINKMFDRTRSTWVYYETIEKEYNVIGIAPGIVGGIIGGKLGSMVGVKLSAIFSVVGGAVAGTLVGGEFAEYYISILTNKYYLEPVTTGRPKTKSDYEVYHGPKYDRYQNYWFEYLG